VTRFANAMKAADPSILVGASACDNKDWGSRFLPAAPPHLDFISVSVYNAWEWGSYDYFPNHPNQDLRGAATDVLNQMDHYAPAADRARLKLIVTEMNSVDYSTNKPWPDNNTLGHALAAFETFGQLMREPRILSAMLWTTRWMNDQEAAHCQCYGLGPANELLPAGRAVALWGQFLREKLIATTGGTPLVSCHASRGADSRELNIWIVNRGRHKSKNIKVKIQSPVNYRGADVYCFSGKGPDDEQPRWEKLPAVAVNGNTMAGLTCPGVSIKVISLRP